MGHQNKTVSETEAVFVLRRRREIRTGFGRLAACVTRNQKGFTPLLPTQCGLKSLSYAHISGGSPKQKTVSETEAVFVLRRRREIRTGFGRLAACVTRNQKGFTPLLPTQCGLKSLSYAHISGGSPKQKTVSETEAVFVLRRRREIRTGFGRLAACVTRNQKGFTPLLPTQCGLKSLSYAHISGGSPKQKTVSETEAVFVLRRRREIRTEFGRLAACVRSHP